MWGHEHLVYVDLSNNNIQKVHMNIEKAKTLQSLYLGNNTLKALPKQIGNTNIIWLMLDGNNFKTIPSAIFNLHNTLFHLRFEQSEYNIFTKKI